PSVHRQPEWRAPTGHHPTNRDHATHFAAGTAAGGRTHPDTGDQVVVTSSSSGTAMSLPTVREALAKPSRNPLAPSDSERWPAVARVPAGALSAASAVVADRLLRRAAARLPLRLVYAGGGVIGAADPTAPTMLIHRPDALARRIGRHGLIGFGESYM